MPQEMTIDNMQEQLNTISQFINDEIRRKQSIIDEQTVKINRLENIIEANSEYLQQQDKQLQEFRQQNEGNRQLINKLLGDLARLQQDLEWYKRTYEERSILGTIKQKLFK